MGINYFIYILLGLSLVVVLYKKDDINIKEEKEQKPQVVFENSTMYDLSTKELEYIAHSKVAKSFKNHEELYEPLILSKSQNGQIDQLSSKTLVKYQDEIYLNGDVKYTRNDGLVFSSEQLNYNLKTKIAQTNSKFKAVKQTDKVEGTYMKYDNQNKKILAKNTNFKIKVEGN